MATDLSVPRGSDGATTALEALENCEKTYLAPVPEPILHLGSFAGVAEAGRFDLYHRPEVVAAIPVLARLESYALAIAERATGPHHKRFNMAAIGLLVDAFPNGRPRDGYLDALLYDLTSSRFSPYVVAEAFQKLRRTSRFLPTIAEVLQACEAVREDWIKRQKDAEGAVRVVRKAREVAARPKEGPIESAFPPGPRTSGSDTVRTETRDV
jgi:hypothetical protein